MSQIINTIIAALRFYQEKGQGDPASRSDRIHDLATNGEQDISLDDAGIDELCENLNTGVLNIYNGEVSDFLEEVQPAVDYYHEHEGCPCLRNQLNRILGQPEEPDEFDEDDDDEDDAYDAGDDEERDWAGPDGDEDEPTPTLEDLRDMAATAMLEKHDFDKIIITDQDGWTRDGKYWSKRLYGDDEENFDKVCLSFGVEFNPESNAVVETWTTEINRQPAST